MRRFILSLVAALALSTPALAQGTTTINNLPAANTPLYCSEVVASWQVYRTVKIPVALAGAVCQAATAPLSPFAGQQWWDTSAGGGLWSLRVYDGASWLPIGRLDTTAHVWTPATNQPVQTVTGASKTFTASDFQFDTRRSNSASAMTDTFPALAAGVNGARITVTNADASAGDTITAASGTTICGANSCGTTTVVPAGRSLAFVFDSANTAWRPSANTATAVLGPTSTASGNLAAFTDTTGKVLTDSGVLPANVVQGPGSATSGNLASYNGTSGKLLADASVAVNQVVTLTGVQTLTNKTLTAPVIATISNTGTLTLPTSTDTLVARATSDTLTNKTLTAPVMTLASNTTSPTASQSAASFTGTILTGGSATTNFPALFIQPTGTTAATTWSTSGTGLGMNLAGSFAGNFLDFHVGGAASVFKVDSGGAITMGGTLGITNAGTSTTLGSLGIGALTASGGTVYLYRGNDNANVELYAAGVLGWSSTTSPTANADLMMTRKGAASLQFGNVDAAAPVAQTIGVQSVVAGTTNTAGAVTTIRNSAGTGTGVGGNIVFQFAPHGSTGTAQNAWSTAVTINGDTATTTFAGNIIESSSATNAFLGALCVGNTSCSSSTTYLSRSNGIAIASWGAGGIGWAPSTDPSASPDTVFYRDSVLGAGNVSLGNGTANDKSGTLNLANLKMTGTLTTGVTGGGSQCAQVSNTGVLSGTGTACASAVTLPTIQKFTTGSGTYTTPAGVRQLYVRMWAGGGGGGSWNGTLAGTTGGTTNFGSTTVIGGAGGAAGHPSPGNGGIGGTGGADTGATTPFRVTGQHGQGGLYNAGAAGQGVPASGGSSFSGAGDNGAGSAGYGGGGSGAAGFNGSSGGSATTAGGGGGGGGEYVEYLINSPSGTYSYAVGAGGAAGTGGSVSGTAGAGGAILILERY